MNHDVLLVDAQLPQRFATSRGQQVFGKARECARHARITDGLAASASRWVKRIGGCLRGSSLSSGERYQNPSDRKGENRSGFGRPTALARRVSHSLSIRFFHRDDEHNCVASCPPRWFNERRRNPIRWRLIVAISLAFWIFYTGGWQAHQPCNPRLPSTCED